MPEVALLCRLLLAGVFTVSGVSKLLDPAGTHEAVTAFGIPARWAPVVAGLLAPVELVVACLLLVVATPTAGPGAALLLLGVFTAAVLENLRRGRRPDCRCFGRIGSSDISGRTVLRNSGLAVAAGIAVLAPPVSAVSYLRASSPQTLVLLVVAAAAGVTCLLGAEARAGRRSTEAWSAAHAEQFGSKLEVLMDRGPAPNFRLSALTGASVTLPDLLTDERPLLLTFLSPGCGPCKRLRPYVARWNEVFADRVRVAAIVSGSPTSNRSAFGDSGIPVLLDEDHAVAAAFNVTSRPVAVVVTPRGRLLGPAAVGDLSVRGLLDALLSSHLSPHAAEVPAAELTLAARLGPRATVTARPDGENLRVVDETTGASATLDGLGAIVWQCLDGHSALEEIVHDIAEEFRAPQDRVAADVLALVESLGRLGLLAGVAADPVEDRTPDTAGPRHAHSEAATDLVGSA